MCSEAKVDSKRLQTGRLDDADWVKLTNACDKLSRAPIFIDDTAGVSPIEIKAKTRRLQSRLDGSLGLVVVDYLQLMGGQAKVENRVQEISQISRALKLIARDLDVPVVALSQLSRALARTHRSGDVMGAARKFLAMTGLHLPEPVFQRMFAGERDAQTVADDQFQHRHMFRPTLSWPPDFAALRSARTRIVVGLGERSAGQLCDRTSRALATELGLEPTMFPGGHVGFVDDADGFAARLREVLPVG